MHFIEVCFFIERDDNKLTHITRMLRLEPKALSREAITPNYYTSEFCVLYKLSTNEIRRIHFRFAFYIEKNVTINQ